MKLQSKVNRLAQEGGFTLIEMLIVVAIIAILVAIAVPALSTAKTDAQTAKQNAIITAVATAKNRAFLKDVAGATAGASALFAHFDDFLLINGVQPALTAVTLSTNNGTGKNITAWGTYPNASGVETQAAFGATAAVTQ